MRIAYNTKTVNSRFGWPTNLWLFCQNCRSSQLHSSFNKYNSYQLAQFTIFRRKPLTKKCHFHFACSALLKMANQWGSAFGNCCAAKCIVNLIQCVVRAVANVRAKKGRVFRKFLAYFLKFPKKFTCGTNHEIHQIYKGDTLKKGYPLFPLGVGNDISVH